MTPIEFEAYLASYFNCPENPSFLNDPTPNEISIVQKLDPTRPPYGEMRMMRAPVGEEAARKAREAGLILWTEWSHDPVHGGLVLHAERPGVAAVSDHAENGPGDKEPAKVLAKLIEKVTS